MRPTAEEGLPIVSDSLLLELHPYPIKEHVVLPMCFSTFTLIEIMYNIPHNKPNGNWQAGL